MADCIHEVETAVDAILEIIAREYDEEALKGEKTPLALLPLDRKFLFYGRPALVAAPWGIAVTGASQTVTFAGRCTASEEKTIVQIFWWQSEPSCEEGHRFISRIGEILKRIFIRNEQLKLDDKNHTVSLRFPSPIILGEEVIDAYTGSRVAFPAGRMEIELVWHESLDPTGGA